MDGILIVDKQQGMTSHDVVDFIRKRFNIKKCGHAGTLDPMATGVLVVLLGKATKVSGTFIKDDKEYEAELFLGGRSDTGDAWGRVVPSGQDTDFNSEKIKEIFGEFLGEIEQVPPMYSAVKVEGRKLYQLARKGVTIEVEPRKISIKTIELLDIAMPRVRFRLSCSKGTYVRQLCVDIGERLGCGGYLSQLKRIRSGKFNIADAVKFDELKTLSCAEVQKRVIAI